MTTNQNEPGAPDGWNYGSGDCLNPACATYGGQGTFKRRNGSVDPRVCSTCAQPERGSIEPNGSFKSATNGHRGAPSAGASEIAAKVMEAHVPVSETIVRCGAGAHVYAIGSATCKLCGHSDAPKVMPGATTALQARCDELAAALAAAKERVAELEQTARAALKRSGDVVIQAHEHAEATSQAHAQELDDLCRGHADELARATRAFAERDRALEAEIELLRPCVEKLTAERDSMERRARTFEAANGKLIAERDAVREQLRSVVSRFDDWEAGQGGARAYLLDAIAAARAALDGTAPAPRPAIEALVAAVNRAIANAPVNMGDGAAPWALPTLTDWDAVIAARDEYEKERKQCE